MEIGEVLQIAYELAEQLQHDPRIIALRNFELRLNQDIEVKHLSQTMHECALIYEASREDEIRLQVAQQQLHQAKLALDSHPLVREYYKIYRPVRELYVSIQDRLFTPFNLHICGDK